MSSPPRRAPPLPPGLSLAEPEAGLVRGTDASKGLLPPSPAHSNFSSTSTDSPTSHTTGFHSAEEDDTSELDSSSSLPSSPQRTVADSETSSAQSHASVRTAVVYPVSRAKRVPTPPWPSQLDSRASEDTVFSASSIATSTSMSPRPRRSSSSSFSESSGKGQLDDLNADGEGKLDPDVEVRSRMKSILGPKMKILSPAPWDLDSDKAQASSLSSTSSTMSPSSGRRSSDAIASSRRHATAAKDSVAFAGVKSRETGRSRSFSVLFPGRQQKTDPEDLAERAQALHGLVSSGLPKHSDSQSKPPSMPSPRQGDSFLNVSESRSRTLSAGARKFKISAPSDLASGSIAFPVHTPIVPPSPSTHGPRSRSRSPASIAYHVISPATPPKSAPASEAAFPASASHASSPSRSESSLTVRIPHVSSPSDLASRIPPISKTPTLSHPSSTGQALSTSSSMTMLDSGHNAPLKLISLEEARQRESERAAAAAARRQAMQPVEFLVEHQEPAPPPSPVRGVKQDVASSRVPPISPPKALKTRKSGFLKRMMGKEYAEPMRGPAQSFRALPDDSWPVPTPMSPSLEFTPAGSDSEGSGSASTASKGTTARVGFLGTPTPDSSLRLRKGLAPSLSLRPVSMAFSAGLPSDFMHSSAETPSTSKEVRPPNSPLAGSYTSSIFDNSDAQSFASTVATPITPGFSPLIPYFHAPDVSPSLSYNGEHSFVLLQEQFSRAKMTWRVYQHDMEQQIKTLQAELAGLKAARTPLSPGLDDKDCQVRFHTS